MATKIKPLFYPNLGTATQIEVTVLSFATDSESCNTNWQMLRTDGSPLQGINGNYELTKEQFKNWGSDNNYVTLCVIKSLPDVQIENI